MTSLDRLKALPAHRAILESEKALLSIEIQRELHSRETTADYLAELELRAAAIIEPKGCECGKAKTCPRQHPELRIEAPVLQLEAKPKLVRESAPVAAPVDAAPEVHPRPDDDEELEVAR